ncbi:bifunctional diguanylate cyclase/phosphodiesterase [Shewanella dokdonensis]|uniref:bifunctional diguanylate cyclase/phosphodiesterase n=1 Tax=Shewanella dokdonensis TaxID=712036 RepID=UPI00200F1A5E|nr:EAL domain-containing protein [Shewanella dokdonensis]MCL1076246.1 EAL domain-containing protein [Shewanella dokdonensis]
MTLFRQIYSLLFGLFLLVVASLGYVQFNETRNFLASQMESDLNNVSHSLGLMLVPALEAGDMATVETMVNVIFEGGYYRKVTLTWLVDGKQQSWNNDIRIDDVPQWFINLNLFPTIEKETTITSGWIQLAKLKITAHPGFGYHELWRIMSNTIIVFSILFLVAIFSARLGLTWILKPLHAIAEHAKNIAKREFGPDMPLPKTLELRDVVTAFNSMSAQLKQIFNSLDEEVTALRKKNLVDQVSELPNRQYMTARLNSWLSEPGSGAMMLVRLDWLEQVHSKYGYQVRDATIKLLASKLQESLAEFDSVIARIAAYEFAFLITNAEREQLSKYLQTLVRTINQEMIKADCKPNEDYAIGIAERLGQCTTSDILSQADNALQKALQAGKVYHWFESSEQQLFTREQWREKLSHAISQKQFLFRWQPIQNYGRDGIIHHELFCQLQVGDTLIHAGQFMPYVELLSLGSLLDRCLIEKVIEQKLLEKSPHIIAVNLTHQSVGDYKFHQWLNQYLREAEHHGRLAFEIQEASIYSDAKASEALCNVIRDNGATFGIDHFGRQFGSMTYLQTLRPSYVKLDLSFAQFEDNQHNAELCRALVNVARGLDIDVIATGIQQETQLQRFEMLKIQGYQGYIAPPQNIE